MSASYPNFGEPALGGSSKAQREKNKKRRWQSRSDEEIAESLDSRNLAYRKGWPQLPPLPVSENRNGARSLVNMPEEIIDTVQTLCQAQRIQVIQVYFAFRTPEVTRAGEHYHTLVVTADLSDDPIVSPLIIQIRKLLQQDQRHEEITIEIIDHRVVHGLFTFAIPPSEEHLLKVWQPVYDHILTEIRDRGEQWLTVEMLYRGTEDDAARCPATVVVTSPTAAEAVWIEVIVPNIHERIRLLAPHLKVELLCGSSVHTTLQGCTIDAQAYNQQVPMGSSIGERELPGYSGTVGGVVKLSNGKTYALTNHHVVRNDDLDTLLTDSSGESLFLEPGNRALNPDKHRFTSPSNQDNKAFIEDRQTYERQWLDQVRAGNSQAQQYLDSTRNELKLAQTTNRSFGTVHASSGLRTVMSEKLSSNPNNGDLAALTGKSQFRYMLDWCLLDMVPSRSMTNTLPMRSQVSSSVGSHKKLMSGQHCPRWTVMNNPKCHILRDEVSVGKFGRTTAFTYGYLNAIPTIINPKVEDGQYKFIAETHGFTVKDSGYSMSVVAHSETAVARGDSGSIVLHAPTGDWLGLLFGETKTKAALITPIDLVFRDIKIVTGFNVVEPIFTSKW